MAEHFIGNEEVRGPIPPISSQTETFLKYFLGRFTKYTAISDWFSGVAVFWHMQADEVERLIYLNILNLFDYSSLIKEFLVIISKFIYCMCYNSISRVGKSYRPVCKVVSG